MTGPRVSVEVRAEYGLHAECPLLAADVALGCCIRCCIELRSVAQLAKGRAEVWHRGPPLIGLSQQVLKLPTEPVKVSHSLGNGFQSQVPN